MSSALSIAATAQRVVPLTERERGSNHFVVKTENTGTSTRVMMTGPRDKGQENVIKFGLGMFLSMGVLLAIVP